LFNIFLIINNQLIVAESTGLVAMSDIIRREPK